MGELRLTVPTSRWLCPFTTRGSMTPPRAQVVLLPHAGGSANTFRPWVPVLPPDLAVAAVEYPGHGSRLGEPLVADSAAVVAELTGALVALQERLDGAPLILGGHSLGALLAHELAGELQSRGRPVGGLFLSGALPPHRRGSPPDLSQLDDNALAATLGAGGDIPAEILQDAEARELYLPIVRHDLILAARYFVTAEGTPLPMPVSAPAAVVGGGDDSRCPAAELGAWADLIDGPVQVTVLAGGHFYYRQQLGVVGRLLDGLVNAAAPAGIPHPIKPSREFP